MDAGTWRPPPTSRLRVGNRHRRTAGQGRLDFDYIGADGSYGIVAAVPQRHEPAPAHILLPALGEALWYGSAKLNQPRERPPAQFFDLTSCGPEH